MPENIFSIFWAYFSISFTRGEHFCYVMVLQKSFLKILMMICWIGMLILVWEIGCWFCSYELYSSRIHWYLVHEWCQHHPRTASFSAHSFFAHLSSLLCHIPWPAVSSSIIQQSQSVGKVKKLIKTFFSILDVGRNNSSVFTSSSQNFLIPWFLSVKTSHSIATCL